MAKKVLQTEAVTEHIQKPDASFAEIVEVVRQTILSADKEIGEQIIMPMVEKLQKYTT